MQGHLLTTTLKPSDAKKKPLLPELCSRRPFALCVAVAWFCQRSGRLYPAGAWPGDCVGTRRHPAPGTKRRAALRGRRHRDRALIERASSHE